MSRRLLVDARKLRKPGTADEHIDLHNPSMRLPESGSKRSSSYRSQTVVDRCDDERPADPGNPCGEQCWRRLSCSEESSSLVIEESLTQVLRDTELICWPREILDSRGYETPLHHRRPEENSFRPCMAARSRNRDVKSNKDTSAPCLER